MIFLIVEIVLWAVVAMLAVILLALAMPLRLELQVSRDPVLKFSAVLRPFGAGGPRISLSDRRKRPKPSKSERKKKARRGAGRANGKRLAQAAVRLVLDLAGVVQLESMTLKMRFGLGDPGETGQLYGQMTPLIYGAYGVSDVDIRVEPLFDRAVLTGRANLDLSLVPLRLLPLFVRFGWAAYGPAR